MRIPRKVLQLSLGVLFTAVVCITNASSMTADGGAVLYVAPNGNDNNPGTIAQPLGTIRAALAHAVAGDTIRVRGGVYHEALTITRSGEQDRPIRIEAYPGENAVLDGEYKLPGGTPAKCDQKTGELLCFVYTPLVSIEASHIIFSGLEITRSRGRGLLIGGNKDRRQQNVTISDCHIHDTRFQPIKIMYADRVTIERCHIHHGINFAPYSRSGADELGWGAGLAFQDSQDSVVRQNIVHENYGEGINIGRNSIGMVTEDNIAYNNLALQFYIHRSRGVLLQRNLAYHTNDPAFWRSRQGPGTCFAINNEKHFLGASTVDAIIIRNNVAVGCGTNIGIWSSQHTGAPVANLTIEHNTLVNAVPGQRGTANGLAVSSVANLRNIRFERNIVLQPDGNLAAVNNAKDFTFTSNLWSRPPSEAVRGPGDIIADPLLTQPNAPLAPGQVQIEWYMPRAESPALAAGIGPYEYLGIPSQPTPIATPSPGPTSPLPTPTIPTSPTVPPPETPVVIPLPGRVEAEDYRTGGEGAGYHDTTPGNAGGVYQDDDVDIVDTDDADGGFHVGWIEASEWLAYEINVTQPGDYHLTARVSPDGAPVPHAFHVEIDGRDRTGPISIFKGTETQIWHTIERGGIRLRPGHQVLRVVMENSGFSLNYLDLQREEQYPGRVVDGLQALYTFDEGSGDTVYDVSGVDPPLDLLIRDDDAIEWRTDALVVQRPVVIGSQGAATKINEACRASSEVTVEAFIRSTDLHQDGPARIVSLSHDIYQRNVTLGQGLWGEQPTERYDVRLRTAEQSENGRPSLSSSPGTVHDELTHVVFTRDMGGTMILYLDGMEQTRGAVSGHLRNWDRRYPLMLANEFSGDRPWVGEYRLVALYCRALGAAEVEQNYRSVTQDEDGGSVTGAAVGGTTSVYLPFIHQ